MSELTGKEKLLGTGERLSAHIDERVSAGDGSDASLPDFAVAMGKALAERIGSHGVVPIGYVMATELLIYDCGTGVNGLTGDRMSGQIAGYPPQMYALFTLEATHLARGAFGDAFADQVDEVRSSINERAAARAQEQEKSGPS